MNIPWCFVCSIEPGLEFDTIEQTVKVNWDQFDFIRLFQIEITKVLIGDKDFWLVIC